MLSVFWLLREKLSLAGGFGCTSVAVESFVFFYKKVSYENPCCIQCILFYISCTVLCFT